MKKTIIISIIAIIAAFLIGYGLGKQLNRNSNINFNEPITKKEPIKIGVIGTLTGIGAYYGEQELNGVKLALDEINQNGGISGRIIELIVEDSQAAPQTAVTALQKLINVNQIKFVIGDSWVSTTAAITPVANTNKIILISPVALLDELSQDDYFFRTIPNTQDMVKPLSEYAFDKMQARKIAIMFQQTPYGVEHSRDFKYAFEKLGGEIVVEEGFLITAKDLQTELTKIKAKNPDTIFNLHASNASIGLLIQQAKELGLKVNWLASFGAENAPLLEQYSQIAEGLIYPYSYDPESDLLSAKQFSQSYLAKYGKIPSLTAANSYDALKLIAMAIEKHGEDTEKIKEFLLSVKNYQGASGVLSFDQNGDVEKPIFMKQIKDGKFQKVE